MSEKTPKKIAKNSLKEINDLGNNSSNGIVQNTKAGIDGFSKAEIYTDGSPEIIDVYKHAVEDSEPNVRLAAIEAIDRKEEHLYQLQLDANRKKMKITFWGLLSMFVVTVVRVIAPYIPSIIASLKKAE
ncbi:MAG: hypothetical protein MJ093_02915 [Saccharofermentans sp.]|nr:hypothetical protein [Saccharofermentans sp.]